MNLRHLDPNARATDACVIGHMPRNAAANATTRVVLTGKQADELTGAAEARDAFAAWAARVCAQLERDAGRLGTNHPHGRALSTLAQEGRALIARAEESRR